MWLFSVQRRLDGADAFSLRKLPWSGYCANAWVGAVTGFGQLAINAFSVSAIWFSADLRSFVSAAFVCRGTAVLFVQQAYFTRILGVPTATAAAFFAYGYRWIPAAWGALPASFSLAAIYLLHLALDIYALRGQRGRFRLELMLLGIVFGVAVGVALLGLELPSVPEMQFFILYSTAIGIAFLLVSVVLGFTPKLPLDVSEAVRETYAVSTLANAECDEALEKLKQFMETERLYQ